MLGKKMANFGVGSMGLVSGHHVGVGLAQLWRCSIPVCILERVGWGEQVLILCKNLHRCFFGGSFPSDFIPKPMEASSARRSVTGSVLPVYATWRTREGPGFLWQGALKISTALPINIGSVKGNPPSKTKKKIKKKKKINK